MNITEKQIKGKNKTKQKQKVKTSKNKKTKNRREIKLIAPATPHSLPSVPFHFNFLDCYLQIIKLGTA